METIDYPGDCSVIYLHWEDRVMVEAIKQRLRLTVREAYEVLQWMYWRRVLSLSSAIPELRAMYAEQLAQSIEYLEQGGD
jgi:hypothetical protein